MIQESPAPPLKILDQNCNRSTKFAQFSSVKKVWRWPERRHNVEAKTNKERKKHDDLWEHPRADSNNKEVPNTTESSPLMAKTTQQKRIPGGQAYFYLLLFVLFLRQEEWSSCLRDTPTPSSSLPTHERSPSPPQKRLPRPSPVDD